jgi:hypothetical protein
MGNRTAGLSLAVAAFLGAAVQAYAADHHKPQWRTVPGHENIVVDMASIAPMWKSQIGPRDYSTNPPTDGPRFPTETTNATVKLNGHDFVDLLTCSGFGANNHWETTVYFPQTRLNEPATKIMGHVPPGVVEALVCPEARRRALQP